MTQFGSFGTLLLAWKQPLKGGVYNWEREIKNVWHTDNEEDDSHYRKDQPDNDYNATDVSSETGMIYFVRYERL